jgi:hypothetical protein
MATEECCFLHAMFALFEIWRFRGSAYEGYSFLACDAVSFILSRTMCDYRRGFGLYIVFIDHLQVVTTNNYNTIAISTLYKMTLSFSTPLCIH